MLGPLGQGTEPQENPQPGSDEKGRPMRVGSALHACLVLDVTVMVTDKTVTPIFISIIPNFSF